MTFKPAWRNFKRMQDLTVAAASLIYAGAVVSAVDAAGGANRQVLLWTLVWPVPLFLMSLVLPISITPLRVGLSRYVWMSFQGGFGQSVRSVLLAVVLLGAVAVFFYMRATINVVAGFVGANVFSAYAAGIGILAAQAVLARGLERLPDVRALIEEK